MKKILLLAITVLLLQTSGFSQKTRVGVTAGITTANMKGQLDGDGKMGVMAGLALDAPLCGKFTFHPSINYVQKGQTEPHPAGTLIEKQYLALRYMELDADFLYNIDGFSGGAFFLGLGPSLAFSLPSKRVSITEGVKTEQTIKFGKDGVSEMKGMDYGVNVRAGFRTGGGFLFSVNYNKGLRNLVPEGGTGELKTSYIGIQLGVFLNNGKSSN